MDMIFEILQSYLIILVESFCCIIFFEIFKSGKRKTDSFASRCMLAFCLSLFSCMEAHLLQENVFIRLFVDAGVTALILSFYFREKLGKCFILSVVFVGLL